MSGELLGVILTGIAGLVTIFFGREYWRSYSGLISDLKAEVTRLQGVNRDLQSRMDKIENRLHQRELELSLAQATLDNYVAMSQGLTEENRQLRERVRSLEKSH